MCETRVALRDANGDVDGLPRPSLIVNEEEALDDDAMLCHRPRLGRIVRDGAFSPLDTRAEARPIQRIASQVRLQ